MQTHENTLSERERRVLTALVNDPDTVVRRRAQVLLSWADGAPAKQIAGELGVRSAQVNKLTRDFSRERLAIFPAPALERGLRGVNGAANVEQFLAQYPPNLKHTRRVTALALQLFDATASAHHVPAEWRRVLETAAQLHSLGSMQEEEAPHARNAYDIILSHDLPEFTSQQRDVIACLAFFSSKKVNPDREALFGEFDDATKKITLALAAVLRVANALDFSKSQTTVIETIDLDSIVDVAVSGKSARRDAVRANKKADLWRETLTPPLVVRVIEAARSPRPPALNSNLTMSAAARSILRTQYDKLLTFEEAVRAGEEDDAVHDMRVASRRMNSAFRLFDRYLAHTKKLHPVLEQLRDALGEARNLDVLLDDLKAYATTAPESEQDALQAVTAEWQSRRAAEQLILQELLDSSAYAAWRERMRAFLESSASERPPRVADTVPALIWKQYGQVRAYETHLSAASLEELHALRIDLKRLRYTLEFFADCFGDKPKPVIEPLVALQDRLGNLHDAVVAGEALTDFIAAQAHHAKQHGGAVHEFQAVAAYHAHLQARIETIRAELPAGWNIIVQPEYRQALAALCAAL